MTNRVSLAFDYDSAWDTSHLGVFELTQTGLIVTKSHLQDFLGGPRISFPGTLKDKETFLATPVALRGSTVRLFPSELEP